MTSPIKDAPVWLKLNLDLRTGGNGADQSVIRVIKPEINLNKLQNESKQRLFINLLCSLEILKARVRHMVRIQARESS